MGPGFVDWAAVGAKVSSRQRQAARRFARLKADGATADAVAQLLDLATKVHDRLWKIAFPPQPGVPFVALGFHRSSWFPWKFHRIAQNLAAKVHDHLWSIAFPPQPGALCILWSHSSPQIAVCLHDRLWTMALQSQVQSLPFLSHDLDHVHSRSICHHCLLTVHAACAAQCQNASGSRRPAWLQSAPSACACSRLACRRARPALPLTR